MMAATTSLPPAAAAAPEWRVELMAPATVEAGRPVDAALVLEALAGFHVNADYPTHFKAQSDDGGTPEKPRFNAERPAGEVFKLRLPIRYLTGGVGHVMLRGVFAFSVCSKEQCLIQKVELARRVEVSNRVGDSSPTTPR